MDQYRLRLGDVVKPLVVYEGLLSYEDSAYLWRFERADERTRTADLCSLRVIHHALQGFARVCKYCISKGVSFLRLALCCTVLRSRWYQSSIKLRTWSHHKRRALPSSEYLQHVSVHMTHIA